MLMIAMTTISRITSNKINTTTILIWIIKDHINSMLIHSTILNRIPMINSIKILTTQSKNLIEKQMSTTITATISLTKNQCITNQLIIIAKLMLLVQDTIKMLTT